MSNAAFDTLGAARKLKTSGLGAEQADAIVEVVSQSTSQFVTVERFDAGIAMLQSRIDAVQAELRTRTDALETKLIARVDAVRADLRTEIARSVLISAGIIVAAVGLMLTVLGIVLTSGSPLALPPP